MYHILMDKKGDFIIVRDTDYKSSEWSSNILNLEWNEDSTAHWDRLHSKGKPITEVLQDRTLILSTHVVTNLAAQIKEHYPELLI